MATSFLTARRWLLLAPLALFPIAAPLRAQDATPIPPGSTNYQKVSVSAMLDLYETLSNKHLIRDANLDGVPPISVNVTGMTKQDSMKLIEATLLLNGVAIVARSMTRR